MNNEKDIDLESLYEYGKFSVKEKNERRGRNPATGEDLILPPRKVIVFISSGILRDKINGKR